MELTREKVVCNECGETRVPVSGGAVCPKGHGKIIPSVSAAALRTYEKHAKLKALPRARRVWLLPGRSGEWRFRCWSRLDAALPPGCVLGTVDCGDLWGPRVALFERIEAE